MATIHNESVNLFQLRSRFEAPGRVFAAYLLRGGEVVERRGYSRNQVQTFSLREAGVYRVRWFVRDAEGTQQSFMSDPFRFRGLREEPGYRPRRRIALLGLGRISAFAALVLARDHDVEAFVDTTGAHPGLTTFFDKPVLDRATATARGLELVGYLPSSTDLTSGATSFDLLPGTRDILTDVLHTQDPMALYRLSRSAHELALDAGARYIQGFIQFKFNCRVPFQARIGEGTRLGVGGIGVVIHPDSVIGRYCTIGQNVTLGGRHRGQGTPEIGDNVWISAGAVCVGGHIGSNVVIGANAVVLDEVPDNCVVAGVPARIVTRDMGPYRYYLTGGRANFPIVSDAPAAGRQPGEAISDHSQGAE